MTQTHFSLFKDGDRVSHEVKGLGTVKTDAATDNLVIALELEDKIGSDRVIVAWDDDRFPVERVPASELEAVPPAEEAISTGY